MKIQEHITAGYTAFNGYVFNEYDCVQYNRAQDTINNWIRDRGFVPENILNEAHHLFCVIIGIYK